MTSKTKPGPAAQPTPKPVPTGSPKREAAPPDVGAEATDTIRTICCVVAPAQRVAVEAVFAAFDVANGTQFSAPDGWLTPWVPGWDGFSEPPPPTLCYFGSLQESTAVMALFEQACEQAEVAGLKWYEAIVIPFERNNPANTVDSIYAAEDYDTGLPMRTPFAGIAAWAIDVLGALPPRENLP